MEMKNLIFYKTTADFDNTGEVLIYRNLLNFLRQYGNVIINDGKAINPIFLNRICVSTSERLSNFTSSPFIIYILLCSLRNLFTKKQVWFVTGVGEHNVCGWKDIAKNIISFLFLLTLKCFKVKILRIGMSIRFGGKIECLSEKLISSVIDYYYVRDSISYNNCKHSGIDKCQQAPDLSWGGFYGNSDRKASTNNILLSFRDFCVSESEKEVYKKELLSKILLLIDYYLAESWCKNIYLAYQCDVDADFMHEIYEMRKDNRVCMINELITLDNADEYYGNVDVIFSNRLHVLLLGYKFGAPTICLSNIEEHKKIVGILKDNGLTGALLDIKIDNSELVNEFKKINKERLIIEEKYVDAEKSNYNQLNSIFQKIFSN